MDRQHKKASSGSSYDLEDRTLEFSRRVNDYVRELSKGRTGKVNSGGNGVYKNFYHHFKEFELIFGGLILKFEICKLIQSCLRKDKKRCWSL